MDTDAQLAQYFAGMWPHLDEHARRLVAVSRALELGYGGISRVSRACGLSRVTLTKGVEELQAAGAADPRNAAITQFQSSADGHQAAGVFVQMRPHASKVLGELGISVHAQRDNTSGSVSYTHLRA